MRQTDRQTTERQRQRDGGEKGNDKYLTKDKHNHQPNCRQHVTGTNGRANGGFRAVNLNSILANQNDMINIPREKLNAWPPCFPYKFQQSHNEILVDSKQILNKSGYNKTSSDYPK